MSKDKTIINPGEPVFGIGEVAYARSSALRGYVEPITIAKVRYDQAIGAYVYRWLKSSQLPLGLAAQAKDQDLAPFEIREEEILTICEALPIHVSVLETQLAKAQSDLDGATDTDEEPPPPPVHQDVRATILQPPAPRFGINEVAYLIDTAETTGDLERMRIEELNFDTQAQEWIYSAVFRKKPGENATVGGRSDLRRNVTVKRKESQLARYNEVLSIRVSFLQRALNSSRLRFNSICASSE
jgi:hypothetical protein